MRGLLTGNSLLRGFTLLARTSGGFNQVNTFRVARFSAQPGNLLNYSIHLFLFYFILFYFFSHSKLTNKPKIKIQ